MMEGSPMCLLDGLPYQWVGTVNVQTLNKYLQSWGLERDGNCLAPPRLASEIKQHMEGAALASNR